MGGQAVIRIGNTPDTQTYNTLSVAGASNHTAGRSSHPSECEQAYKRPPTCMRKQQTVGTASHPFQQQQQAQRHRKGVVKAGRQAMYHGLHGCGCSLLVMVVLAQHLGLLLGTEPLERQVR